MKIATLTIAIFLTLTFQNKVYRMQLYQLQSEFS
jgi:hypothetical protein